MKIDVLIFRQNFKDAEKAFDQFNQVANKLKLPTDKRIEMISTANWATLLFARGLKALEGRNFIIAKKNFFESFKQYEARGDKKITNPIPYYWLGSLLSRDVADVSQMPEFRAHLNHPYVAPMKKLCDSYSFQNVQAVKELKVGYDKIFCSSIRPIYNQFFDSLVEFCVESAIIIESKAYSRVSFQFLSDRIKYDAQQIERISANLIANRRLSGLIDDEQKALIMVQSPTTSSSFLDSVNSILSTLENLCSIHLD
uniref:COP9 signalosome complex subunit 2 n=1 Tax=Coptotermes formosanus TaxID=36987 RepID=R4ULE7_COPFO|nr:COP9 signalosome complex subunit 2 [Coptotermes formosanus]